MVSGTRVRSLNLMQQLASKGWRVSLFSLGGPDPMGEADRALLESSFEDVVVVPFDPGSVAQRLRAVAGIARRRAFQQTYFISRAAASSLGELIARRRFDVLIPGQLYTLPYVPAALHPRTILDAHNAELRRVEAMASVLWPSPRGLVAAQQRRPVAAFEAQAAGSVAGVMAVSEEERRYFERFSDRVALVPNGVDCDAYRVRSDLPGAPEILFVGSMNYSANLDAVRYLIDEILPRLRRRDAHVTVVGADPPRQAHHAARTAGLPVELTGRVESTEPYFERCRIIAVPLRFGGGTRLKILEAMARGVPVVTTSLGCEGLGLVAGREAAVADDPASFAAQVDRLLEDDELCRSLARRARELVERRFDWSRIGDRLEAALQPALDQR